MFLSVLICTYNRHDLLRFALVAILDKTIEKPDEIIVVNAGDEQADMVVNEFKNRHNIQIHLVKTTNRGPAANRNIGLPLCKGDIVAITDDDAQVNPDWVMHMKRLHAENPDIGAVGGRVVGIDSHESFVSRLIDVSYFPSWPEPLYVTTLPTVNISYKRVVLEQVGLFDELLRMGEDVDYNWRVIKAGYKILYHPTVLVAHDNPGSLLYYWRRHYMAGHYYYMVRSKWPDMYCVYPQNLRSLKNLLKGLYFLLAVFYEPFVMVNRLGLWLDRLRAIPVLVIAHIMWKIGIISQLVRRRTK